MGGKSTDGIDFSSPSDGAANLNLKDESHLKGTMSGDLSGFNEEEDDDDEEVSLRRLFPNSVLHLSLLTCKCDVIKYNYISTRRKTKQITLRQRTEEEEEGCSPSSRTSTSQPSRL